MKINFDKLAEIHFAQSDPQFQKEYEDWDDAVRDETVANAKYEIRSTMEDFEEHVNEAYYTLTLVLPMIQELELHGEVSDYDFEEAHELVNKLNALFRKVENE